MRRLALLLAAALLAASPLAAQKAKSLTVTLPVGKPAAIERVLAAILARDLAVESSQEGIIRTTEIEKDGRQIRFVATVVPTSDSTSLVQWRADGRSTVLSKAFGGDPSQTWVIGEGTRGFVGVAWTHLRALAAATRGDSTAATAR